MKGTLKYCNKILRQVTVYPFAIFAAIFTCSCQQQETFPNTPQITFKNLRFVENPNDGVPDSLILSFDFQDGDGNLGLPSDDKYYPVHDYYAIVGPDKKPISISEATLPETQFRYVPPDFTRGASPELPDNNFVFNTEKITKKPAFDCDAYEIVYINNERTDFFSKNSRGDVNTDLYSLDTILIKRNDNRYNFFIDLLRKRGNQYEKLNFSKADENGCLIPLNGRFPLLDIDNIGSPLEGTIKYAMQSLGFRIKIRADSFKLKFYIKDHNFTKSNVVETEDFTLDQLIDR